MIPTYCITCIETPERGESARQHFKEIGLDVTFVQGIHGHTWGLRTVYEYEEKLTPGHVGLNLSHWMTWQIAYLANHSEVIILEDDAYFDMNFLERSQAAYKQLPKDWQFVYVGWIARSDKKIEVITPLIGKVHYPFGTHAYLVKRSALSVLMDTNREARYNIDIQIEKNTLPTLNVYIFNPSLAKQHSYDGHWPRTIG